MNQPEAQNSYITLIHMMNYGPHTNTIIRPSRGLNVIFGGNNVGKSSVLRALSAATIAPHPNATQRLFPPKTQPQSIIRQNTTTTTIRITSTHGTVGIDTTNHTHAPHHTNVTGNLNLTATDPRKRSGAVGEVDGVLGEFVGFGYVGSSVECLRELREVLLGSMPVSLWEHPERFVVGECGRVLVRGLLRLAASGVQVFVSTHDFGLLKEFELSCFELRGELGGDAGLLFHSLVVGECGVRVSSSGSLGGVGDCSLVGGWRRLLGREVGCGLPVL
jgi:hypothetical protein